MKSRKSALILAVLLAGCAALTQVVVAAADRADEKKPAADPQAAKGEAASSALPGYAEVAQPFLQRHCQGCHGAKQAKAGYRIDLLGVDFTAANVADGWKEVIDRINAGEMPPEESPRPDAKDTAAFVAWVNARLSGSQLALKHAGGRTPMRRLNRDEYANTVRDLLYMDESIVRPLMEELPGDGKAEGFDRLGAALFFDQTQIERSLAAAQKISERAIVSEPPKVNRHVDRLPFLRRPLEKVPSYESSPHKIPRGAPERVVKGDAIEYIQGSPVYRKELLGWGGINHFSIAKVVTRDGYYRFRIKATVDNRGRTEKNKFRLQYGMDSPIQVEEIVELDPSGMTEAMLFLRGPVNGEVKGPRVFRLLWNHTEKAIINEPNHQKTVYQRSGLSSKLEKAANRQAPAVEVAALRKELDEVIAKLNNWEGPAYIYNPEMDIEKLPRLLIESIEVEGPIQKEWPPASHRALHLTSDHDRQDAGRLDSKRVSQIFARFLPRAYRRPVTTEEVDAIVAIVSQAQRDDKLSFTEAMRVGLQRVLCSPGFLFLQEPSGDAPERLLTGHELASRLSYFLWSTMPDDELFALAAAGRLKDGTVLAAQLKRMLADPKARQLTQNFAGQWLSVRDFDTVQPAAEYKDYDKLLQAAARQEPYAFFAEVLEKNLPITSFLDSNFLVINERLAKHYGIEGVTGAEFRRVAIRPEHRRGGVLGMAGLMTFLADGTRTLPMRRGAWVLRELLGDPPNDPPPNAGEIQPNTAGKNLTVRERLELHRRDEICASCHFKLDPFGLALENYDAIGRWRDHFNGEGFRGRKPPLLDISGTLPDGTKITTLAEYKTALMAQKDKFARAFSIKMLTYALGRPVGYSDRELVDTLVVTLKKNDYKIHSLLEAIATSQAFRTK